MRMISIPNTGLTASVLCLGTGDMGAGIEHQASFRMLDEFIAGGGNFIDTAKIYSDWIPGESSRSEKLIGEWMKAQRNRAQVVLATKGAHPELASMQVGRLSPGEIASDLEASLRHLGTETVDLYWLHRDDPARPVAEILETLHDLARSGKLRHYGCSNWGLERIREAQAYAAGHGIPGFVAVQNLWNLAELNRDGFADKTIAFMGEGLWQYHRELHLAAVPYSSQANGLFQKLEKTSDELPANLQRVVCQPGYAGAIPKTASAAPGERLDHDADRPGLFDLAAVPGVPDHRAEVIPAARGLPVGCGCRLNPRAGS